MGRTPRRHRDPAGPADALGSLVSSLWSLAAVSTGAGAAHRAVLMALRRLLVGRRVAWRLEQGRVEVTVTEFTSHTDLDGLSAGIVAHLRVGASDVLIDDSRFDRAIVDLYDVRVRSALPPALVAGPVVVSAWLPTDVLDDVFRLAAPRLTGEIGPDAVARLRLATRPAWGHVEVDARLTGATLWLRPRAVALRRARMTLPRRTPAYPVRLPELPQGLQLTGVAFGPGEVRLSGALAEFEMPLPGRRVEHVVDQLAGGGARRCGERGRG